MGWLIGRMWGAWFERLDVVCGLVVMSIATGVWAEIRLRVKCDDSGVQEEECGQKCSSRRGVAGFTGFRE